MQLSSKQNEYIVNATHRWNFKSGAVRSGKSFVDTAFVIPFRIRERAGKAGLPAPATRLLTFFGRVRKALPRKKPARA